MIDYSEAKWNKNKLYVRKEYTGVQLLQDLNYPKMWWIEEDGKIGEDYYNKTRAKDHAMRIYCSKANRIPEGDLEKPAGAFK